jgi:hypothetical protein
MTVCPMISVLWWTKKTLLIFQFAKLFLVVGMGLMISNLSTRYWSWNQNSRHWLGNQWVY